ncbi:MAG: 4-hydroxy-tetrahydrodipicolinate reductase [Bacteroidales bacterium]|nr:4-hydroxy-tetrahydrodipicolinate reductase [Bacteroidales bacterium]
MNEKIKFAILGYGKMGKMVESMLRASGYDIVAIIDNEEEWQARMDDFRTADVAIDFSMPSVAVSNMVRALECHVPIVVGTTGWYDRLDEIVAKAKSCHGSLVYGTNFSIGVYLFNRMNQWLASEMSHYNQYAVSVEETHHTAKKDAPSGTAITLAESIVSHHPGYSQWQLCQGEPVGKEVIPVQAHRVGEVAGIHQIQWSSPEDEITIIHNAHGRQGFAAGAIRTAIWLVQHPGAVCSFAETFEEHNHKL